MDAQSCPVTPGAAGEEPDKAGEAGVPKLPPGPRLPVFVQTWLLRVATPWFLRRCRARYGDVFTVHDAIGGREVYLADPEHIRAVFAGDPAVLLAGEGNGILGPVLGQRSVLLLDGADHRDRRKLLLPAFHGEQVRRQEALIREVVTDRIATWPVGTVFRAHERTRDIALEIILRVVLGVREPARTARLRTALPRVVDLSPADLLMLAYPRLQSVGRWRRYWEHKAEVNALLDDEIALRRDDPGLAERDDVLSSLVRAYVAGGQPTDDGDLRDQLVTLLLAGHETTATALAWTLELLSRNPSVQHELRTGLAEYSGAVVTEALRIRPVISLVARHIHQPVRVGTHLVPAGVTLCPGISLVQTDPAQHPDPERFDPGRWLGPNATQGMVFPFGGGVRRCLGAPFAVAELRVAVEEIVRRYHLHPVGRRPERVKIRNITAVPSRGARITVTPV